MFVMNANKYKEAGGGPICSVDSSFTPVAFFISSSSFSSFFFFFLFWLFWVSSIDTYHSLNFPSEYISPQQYALPRSSLLFHFY